MRAAQARTGALDALRSAGEWLPAAAVAARVGCGHRKLTGDTSGVLLLLEAEGLVERTGGGRGTRWRAVPA